MKKLPNTQHEIRLESSLLYETNTKKKSRGGGYSLRFLR